MSSPSGPCLSAATAQALELPSLLAVIAELAATDLGRRRVLELHPLTGEADLAAQRQRCEEVARLLATGGRLVPSLEEPLGEVLEALVTGRPEVHGRHLVRLDELLRTTGDASRRVAAADPPCPALGVLTAVLPDLEPLRRRIAAALDRRGEVRDDASPELVRLRARIRRVRDQLYQQLTGYVEQHRESFSEETVPLRDGRLVLTLQAGAHGRLQGLTHGRSATGKSFYFEPLEVVEPNNQLRQAVDDEEAERRRILAELIAAARAALPALESHAAVLAELDLQQAAERFAQISDGRLAELATGRVLRLVAARHPLLDGNLAELRQRALGQAGHSGPVVPLDLSLGAPQRALVVTGPNAGGKTVALKTLGLLTAATLCGLPIPAATGSCIPFLHRLVAAVGDDQDLLSDRSTFSGRLLRLKEAWLLADDRSLLLLDELGSGTDPAEGSALATSLLEGLLERGSLVMITTHLTPVAAAAVELEGAGCAAMEFAAATGRPTFRLVPGPPGGSEALALARRLGLPEEWLARAEARLGSEYRDLRRLLAEVEDLRQRLGEDQLQLQQEVADAAKLRQRLAEREDELRQERKSLGPRLQRELDEFRAQTRQRLSGELERLRRELEQGRRKGLEAEAVERLFATAPQPLAAPEPEPGGPPVVGAEVRHRSGWQGILDKLEGDRAEVLVRGKRVRCAAGDLAAATAPATPRPAERAVAGSGRDLRDLARGSEELNLIGLRVEPALELLDGHLDRALMQGTGQVRVIHGHGSGRLREAVRQHLRQHPAVATARPGDADEGGNGATIATLRG